MFVEPKQDEVKRMGCGHARPRPRDFPTIGLRKYRCEVCGMVEQISFRDENGGRKVW